MVLELNASVKAARAATAVNIMLIIAPTGLAFNAAVNPLVAMVAPSVATVSATIAVVFPILAILFTTKAAVSAIKAPVFRIIDIISLDSEIA